MPFKSKAQQRFLEAKRPKGVNLKEWEQATKAQPGGFKALPERAKPKPQPANLQPKGNATERFVQSRTVKPKPKGRGKGR